MKRAICTFHGAGPVTVIEGALYDDKAPIVSRFPAMFEDAAEAQARLAAAAEPVVFRAVEQATAAPGEKRSTPRKS